MQISLRARAGEHSVGIDLPGSDGHVASVGFDHVANPLVGPHMPGKYLAGSLFVAMDQQIAAFGPPISKDAKARSPEADVPGAEERQPAEYGAVGQEFASRRLTMLFHWTSVSLKLFLYGLLMLRLLTGSLRLNELSGRHPAHPFPSDGLNFLADI